MKPPAFKKYMHECASAPDLFGGDRRKNGKLDGVQFFPLADVKTLCESTCERHSWGNTLRKRFAERCLETLCRGTFDGHPGKCSVKTVKDLAPNAGWSPAVGGAGSAGPATAAGALAGSKKERER
jgi:hypothetical protein